MIWMLTIPSRPDRWSSTIPDQQTPRPCCGRCCCCCCCYCFVLWIFVFYIILFYFWMILWLPANDEKAALWTGGWHGDQWGRDSHHELWLLLQGWSPWTANSVGFFCLLSSLLSTILVPDFSAVNLRYSGWSTKYDAAASMLIHRSCSCCHVMIGMCSS